MVAMKSRLVLVLLSASLASAACAHATILPDACGDDSVKFDVKTEKNKTPPVPPEAGKAQIVFIENENSMVGLGMYATVRYGMDGTWVGANHSNSYFTVPVNPGVHHLCVSWQSAGPFKKAIDMASFTAEPGKVYYYSADVDVSRGHDGTSIDFSLSQMDEDEGKYRIKAWKLATWKTK